MINGTNYEHSYLTSGGFGDIYISEHSQAVKKIDKNNLNIFKKEVEMSLILRNCANIVKIRKSFAYKGNGYLLMDLCDIDLLHFLKTRETLSEREIASYFLQICKAIKEIHSMGVSHLDLKLENILLSNNQIKLADFGSATKFKRKEKKILRRRVGTHLYVAPELLKQEPIFPSKADIWSLGIILHVLAVRCFPVFDPLYDCTPSNFTLCHLNDSDVSVPLKRLISKILKISPQDRYSLDNILYHPWLIKNAI